MGKFEESYKQLNNEQLKAVNQVDGPLLVIAGPGTGKTQLLSMRVANILNKTDVGPDNILCLTFTESGAQNMRDRLRSLIGDTAYDVTISTYHSFGSDIIKNYREYFQQIETDRTDDIRMERPIDELTQIQIIEDIISKLPYDSPLIGARYYIKDVVGTIGDLKQNLISSEDLEKIASENLKQIAEAQKSLDSIVNDKGGISRRQSEKYSQFEELAESLSKIKGSLVSKASIELEESIELAHSENSTKSLTKWKNSWLHKNQTDKFTLTDPASSYKMLELATIYKLYNQHLTKTSSYDFNDMILRAIEGLKTNSELKFNLQEKYQYILLDEFQDTNPAQFELIKQISDHPVHEGRPNVMAVGDDDQAIFAFQGAHVGNMKDFIEAFRDVRIINLTESYRSHEDIIKVAENISGQITDKLHEKLHDISKQLVAKGSDLPKSASIERHEFIAEAGEYKWVVDKIKGMAKNGASLESIAVIAPRHAILESTVPFFKQANIPVTYEKRENILDTEIVQGLFLASVLIEALNNNDIPVINQYFPVVLGLPFWELPQNAIWATNWEFAKKRSKSWPELALENKDLASAVGFYLKVSTASVIDPLEITLDKLTGTVPVKIEGEEMISPLKNYYFSKSALNDQDTEYYETISHLSVIRSKLRDYQAGADKQLKLSDFIQFYKMYQSAEMPLVNSHPIAQGKKSVQLLTAYKAKGLEFDNVFILQAHDDVWGSASRGNNNKLSLPPNLSYIRYGSSSDDERLRLFFVSLTRARHGLYITSHKRKESGKLNTPLKYLNESDGISGYLPKDSQQIIGDSVSQEETALATETLWQAGRVSLPSNFKSLLAERIRSYQLSPTHLNSFLDMEYGGPGSFLENTILRFPQAPHPSGEFGTAVHNTLEWLQNQINQGSTPPLQAVLDHYDTEINSRYMTDSDRKRAREKGRDSIERYLSINKSMFSKPAKAEVNFYNEGVTVADAHLSGKIDRLEINEEDKSVSIVDYKTGKPLTKWDNSTKAHNYKQQLYFYKILIENSNSWRNYKVVGARLEFVELPANKDDPVTPPLILEFDKSEEDRLKNLITVVWQHVTHLEFPDVSNYAQSMSGTIKFENDLLDKKI